VAPEKEIFRVARKPDPWQPPDWARAHDDGTFGNRFDDSEGYFRVIYAGSTCFTCFVETLARFRHTSNEEPIATALAEITDGAEPTPAFARVPGSWLTQRAIGTAHLNGKRYADVYASAWLSYFINALRSEIAAASRGESEPLDLARLMSQKRSLTQKIATHVYQLGYDGIYYQSRHGVDLSNWALFELFQISQPSISDIVPSDPDFQSALTHWGLTFNPNL
jgi:hypothetical protein